jgi:biotin carboxyl carrier protein
MFNLPRSTRGICLPFGRIIGIRFNGYNLSPLFLGTPSHYAILSGGMQRYIGNLELFKCDVIKMQLSIENGARLCLQLNQNLHICPMFTASANQSKFEIKESENGLIVNEKLIDIDLIEVSDGYFHIIHNNRGYRAEIVKADPASKSFQIKINGKVIAVAVKDRFDLLLEKMGMSGTATNRPIVIKAPMPGLIIDLKVKEGDAVKAGDPLLILEAMKMENIIKAPGEGIVKKINSKKGDSVEKNQVLIQF